MVGLLQPVGGRDGQSGPINNMEGVGIKDDTDRHRTEGAHPRREQIRLIMWEKHLLRFMGMEYCV